MEATKIVMSNRTFEKFKSVPLYHNPVSVLFMKLKEFKEVASENQFQNEVNCNQVEHITQIMNILFLGASASN